MEKFNSIVSNITKFSSNYITTYVALQFLATVLVAFMSDDFLSKHFNLLSNTIGYSIISNLMTLVIIWFKPFRYCEIVRAMVLSLILSNVVSILATYMTYDYYSKIFDQYFISAFSVLFYILIKKKYGHICA